MLTKTLEQIMATIIIILGGIFAITIVLTIAGAFLILFSAVVDCITGFDLIREVIRPLFERLR